MIPMKRSLLLSLFLLSAVLGAVQAQPFMFQYQGRSLADGDTVTIAAAENAFGELACETNPVHDPANGLVMNLLMGTPTNVKATLEITANTLTCLQLQWCMGGECLPLGGAVQFTKQFKASATEQVQLDAYGIEGDGCLIAKLTVSSVFGSQTVYIRFYNGILDSIRSITPGHGTHVPTVKGGDEALYTLDGRKIVHRTSKKRTFPKGVYIINGKKVLVRENR